MCWKTSQQKPKLSQKILAWAKEGKSLKMYDSSVNLPSDLITPSYFLRNQNSLNNNLKQVKPGFTATSSSQSILWP